MNTATAARAAKVTVATIRTWIKRNVIAAVKVGGRWVIEADTLTHRIALGTKEPQMIDLTGARVTERQTPDGRRIRISKVAALFAPEIAALPEELREHATWDINQANIHLADYDRPDLAANTHLGGICSKNGQIAISNPTPNRALRARLVEIAEQLHAQLIQNTY